MEPSLSEERNDGIKNILPLLLISIIYNLEQFSGIGKILLFTGLAITIIGALILAFGKIPFLGKLPGDIIVEKKNFTFYFPLATSIILSILISLFLYLIKKF